MEAVERWVLSAGRQTGAFPFTGGPFIIGESAPIPQLETASGGFDDLALVARAEPGSESFSE